MLVSYEDNVVNSFSEFKFTEAELASCDRIYEILQKKRKIHSKDILKQNITVNDFLLFLWNKGFVFHGSSKRGLRKLSPRKQSDRDMEKLLFLTSSPLGANFYAYHKLLGQSQYKHYRNSRAFDNHWKHYPIYVIKDDATILKDIESENYFSLFDDTAQSMAQNELLTRQSHKVDYEIIIDDRLDFTGKTPFSSTRTCASLIFPR